MDLSWTETTWRAYVQAVMAMGWMAHPDMIYEERMALFDQIEDDSLDAGVFE